MATSSKISMGGIARLTTTNFSNCDNYRCPKSVVTVASCSGFGGLEASSSGSELGGYSKVAKATSRIQSLGLSTTWDGGNSNISASMDKWLYEAVVDVVKHLKDSPFLHLVFHNRAKKGPVQHVVPPEIFDDPENWSTVKDTILANQPDGFILVQRLSVEEASKCYGSEFRGVSMDEDSVDLSCPKTDVWGLVVQGREKRKHGCYILKTTRIHSVAGSCTNFSLTRAKCFGPALHKQIENSWLL